MAEPVETTVPTAVLSCALEETVHVNGAVPFVTRNERVSLVNIESVVTSNVGLVLTVTTTHVSPAGFTCEAHTFTDPLGTFAGAVYVADEVTPPDVVTVPTVELPPSTPFTFQVNGPVPPDVTLIVVDAPVTSAAVV
jgi:hypothetical protein